VGMAAAAAEVLEVAGLPAGGAGKGAAKVAPAGGADSAGLEEAVEVPEAREEPGEGLESEVEARLGVYFRRERLQVGILIRPSHPPQRSPL
jgi:hypothetical protein